MNVAWHRTTGILAACGIAAMLALAGCSSGGSSHPAAKSTAKADPSAAPSPLDAHPSWASALGSGVTVTAPGSPAPGNGSPGAAVSGFISAVTSKQYSEVCTYLPPSEKKGCESGAKKVTAGDAPTVKNGTISYVATDGSKAVVGTTGTFCSTGNTGCSSNTDPAAIFSSAHSFSALWKNASTPSTVTQYALTPCTETNGKWYIASS